MSLFLRRNLFTLLCCLCCWCCYLQVPMQMSLDNVTGRVHADSFARSLDIVKVFDMCSLPSISFDCAPVYFISIADLR